MIYLMFGTVLAIVTLGGVVLVSNLWNTFKK